MEPGHHGPAGLPVPKHVAIGEQERKPEPAQTHIHNMVDNFVWVTMY